MNGTFPPVRRVVVIMTDTTRWDMLSCYRDVGLHTPYLDELAASGIRYERTYTTTPVCGPARAALFTGTWNHSNGTWATGLPLGQNVRTIGQRLEDGGVHTAYIGKWHLDGTDYFGSGLCPPGWDDRYWYDGRRHLESLSYADRQRSRDPRTNDVPGLESSFTFAHRCTDRALDFLAQHADESFFLTVSYDEPHDPSISPAPYATMYDAYRFPAGANVADTLERKPRHQQVWAGGRQNTDRTATQIVDPAFFGSFTYVDAQIGRVLDAVESYCPDAMIIYTSDHGTALESHCLSAKGPAMYDEIARVPLLVRWPGATQPGAVHADPASHIDIAPTVLAAMGHATPPSLDGQSMIPTLLDATAHGRDYVFCEFGRYEVDHDGFGGFQPLRGIVDRHHKLVINLLSDDELYDVQTDPQEMVNLIESAEHRAVRDALHDHLLDWMHETRDPFRGYYWERRPWRVDAAAPTWAGRGMTRQREDDGYERRTLDYATGWEMGSAVRPKD